MNGTDFVISNGTLISYAGTKADIVIPENVVRIGAEAFKNNQDLRTVSFAGNTLKSIEPAAFAFCDGLECVTLPEGLIQICGKAFYACNSLVYVQIPSTVMIIEDDAIVTENRSFFILGKAGSQAEKYANHREFTFKTDAEHILQALQNYSLVKSGIQTRTFDVFGEIISCSNSISRYHAVLEYYAERKDQFFTDFFNSLPSSLENKGTGNSSVILEAEQANTLSRLDRYGIISGKFLVASELHLLSACDVILKATQAIVNAYKAVYKCVRENIDDNYEMLLHEAENRVTGLSYGRIGSSFDMVLYAVDDYRARQRQRKEAYAQAEEKAEIYRANAMSEAEKAYTSMLQKIQPSLRQGTDMFMDALCEAEIQKLTEEGFIDAASVQSIDIAKSTELVNSILDTQGDNSFVIGLAIKKYPCNMAAYVYAYENGYQCDDLEKLVAFLGFTDKLATVLERNRELRYRALMERAKEAAARRPEKFAKLMKQSGDNIKQEDIQALYQICGDAIREEIRLIAIRAGDLSRDRIQMFCRDELSEVIHESDWDTLTEVADIPIDPNGRVASYPELCDYLYREALNEYEETVAEGNRKRKQVRLKVAAVILVLLAVAAVGLVFRALEEKKYRDFDVILDSDAVSIRDFENADCDFTRTGRGTQLVADKLSEYHAQNKMEEALELLATAYAYMDDDCFYASDYFVDWLKSEVNYAESYRGTKKISAWYCSVYELHGHYVAFTDHVFYLDVPQGSIHDAEDFSADYTWFELRTSEHISWTSERIEIQIQ